MRSENPKDKKAEEGEVYRRLPESETEPEPGPEIESEVGPEVPDLTLNFLELSPEEKRILAERIQSHRGLVRIFVHPFFEIYTNPEAYLENPDYHRRNPRAKSAETILKRILEKEPSKTPPIIVLEGQKKLTTTARYLSLLAKDSGNPVYLVPTRSLFSPVPSFAPPGVGDKLSESEAWQKFTQELLRLGVKRAIVGGMRLAVRDKKALSAATEGKSIMENWDNLFEAYRRQRGKQGAASTDYYLLHCVGWTIGELSRAGIEIEVSTATHPHSRREIREKERSGGGGD